MTTYATNIIKQIEVLTSESKDLSEEEKNTLEQLQTLIKNVVFTRNNKGQIIREEWFVDGIIKRSDGPSSVSYYENGNIMCESWSFDGKNEPTEGLIYAEYYENGNIGLKLVAIDCDSSYIVEYHKNGKIKRETWTKKNEKQHRAGDKPADIVYYENGNVHEETWYEHGLMHRICGPAFVAYYENGNIIYQSWHEFGKVHRSDDGPTIVSFNEDGTAVV